MTSIEIKTIYNKHLREAAEYADQQSENPNGELEVEELAAFFSKASENGCQMEDILDITNLMQSTSTTSDFEKLRNHLTDTQKKEEQDTTIGKVAGGFAGAAVGVVLADKACSMINRRALFNSIPKNFKGTMLLRNKVPLDLKKAMMHKIPMSGGKWGVAIAAGALVLGALGAYLGGKVQEQV